MFKLARRVFFSFQYEQDIWRANVVRNSWVTKDRESAGFWDASLWEKTKIKGENALKNLINEGLKNTSVTVVLIGRETANRKWVLYEIKQSHNRGNGLLGIYIHGIKDQYSNTDIQGPNPFKKLYIDKGWYKKYLSELYPTYYWKVSMGYHYLGQWIEEAAQKAGK